MDPKQFVRHIYLIYRLYVGHITQSEEQDLRDFFSKWGAIKQVWVARQPPGFGYVTFENEADAERALAEGQGQVINGELIKLEVAKGRVICLWLFLLCREDHV